MEKSDRPNISGEIKVILKKVSRTLYLSLNILPEPVRTSMSMGYLLCRALDTVVSAPRGQQGEKLKVLALARELDNTESAAALLADIRGFAALPIEQGERELLLKFGKVLSVYSSFPPGNKQLIAELLRGVAAGMETEVRTFPGGEPAAFRTVRDLESYCANIGGSQGVFWASLYREAIRSSGGAYSHFPSARDAEMLGSALQMTNILKDLAADLRLGRCYIPQEDLAARNLKPSDLLLASNMGRLRDITVKWMYWVLDRLDQCEAFVSAIPKTEMSLRAAAIWPVYWAMDTLEQVAHSNLLDPENIPRVKRNRIYSTIAATPPLLLSNTAFSRGYRFRRETLIGSITGGNYEGRAI